ncbi:electron transfer flavoprotein subunit alpha/FixB family protein [Actinomycetospora sp. TBRC 11914]|uniref:electron transfer flavoprotein subunit alpha/FixB family protein n=1 Tax=Actinomycetospora sp. TBRC 11914 TaxID=2729387 RepID=UPI00145CDE30|nr:electron transfer flavoprotein subunit alpha/FixB family protein [Actinomycetospora sp. TBRC 11914]NMO92315.1 electron transfer flavoprotein subunit alpha/FixB family protein [Actinomycetospora sp. TBRC 11914]
MVLAVVERDGRGSLSAASGEVLGTARELAERLGVAVAAVAVGEAGDLPDDLAKQGVGRLHLLAHELLDGGGPARLGEALAGLVATLAPAAVLGADEPGVTDAMAWAATMVGAPLATACTEVRPGDDAWEVTRERSGGILLEDAVLAGPVRFCTLRPGGPAPSETAAAAEVTVDVVVPELDTTLPHATLVERRERSAGMSLATAPVVVAGGRGVGSAGGYAVLEELAGLVGGVVGCSRVATNNGWRPHSDQVGLTGTRISPDLYVACGISGATQHWVGCMNARSILAVNTDPEAPMVTRATWAVIGDVHTVLPAVVAEIRERSRRR